MKEKIITVFMYIVLVFISGITVVFGSLFFSWNDIVNYYHGGVLKYIFIFIYIAAITLPIIKYRKYDRKWVLPTVLSMILLVTPVFNTGILKIVEDRLEIYSKQNWEKYRDLRFCMLDDLERSFITEGITTREYVIDLLGEPDVVNGENSECIEYYVCSGIDPGMYYIQFENDIVVKTGKRYC